MGCVSVQTAESGLKALAACFLWNRVIPKEAFDYFARDSNGTVSLGQFTDCVKKILPNIKSDECVNMMFEDIDENKDGLLDRSEWVKKFDCIQPEERLHKAVMSIREDTVRT